MAWNQALKMASEVQAGFGYPISQASTLSVLYQGIFGSKPQLSINDDARVYWLCYRPTRLRNTRLYSHLSIKQQLGWKLSLDGKRCECPQ